MVSRFDSFIESLASVPSACGVANQYAYESEANSIRRENLRLYLEHMAALRPDILLVGEAPGYRGCRLTGVPFTSEFIMLNGSRSSGLFGQSKGYRKASESTRIYREQSATIVWETLGRLPKVPLLWNAFPFHPYKMDNQQSNRIPNSRELETGKRFLEELVGLFDIGKIAAVGNTAEATLAAMGIACCKIRHPANGGKREFVEGIGRLIR